MLKNIESLNFPSLEFLQSQKDFLLDEFCNKNLHIHPVEDEENVIKIKKQYKHILEHVCNGDMKSFTKSYIKLTNLYIELEIPYITILNELNHLQHVFMDLLINNEKKDEVITIYRIFTTAHNIVAKEYLDIYIEKLNSVCNHRLSSLSDMVEKFVVEHYAEHLLWLINLTVSIKRQNSDVFPQTDKTLCTFGKWLSGDAKKVVKNNSKIKELDRVHSQLHYISIQVKNILTENNKDYDVLLTYLEKAELLSLSIGTELALIDNTIINQKSSKDPLTGALSRQVLGQLFQNQYELSLATNTNFILAICDLDKFKNINDTHGHIVGDKMLKAFIKIVKETLRNSDIVIRYGGEEFVIILPAVNKEKAFLVLDQIRKNFENFTLKLKDTSVKTTVSMGMIEIEPKDRYNTDLLDNYIECADIKLYKAKNSGRNNIKYNEN